MRRVVAFALLLLAAGCVPEPAFDNDPLVGGGRPLPAQRHGAGVALQPVGRVRFAPPRRPARCNYRRPPGLSARPRWPRAARRPGTPVHSASAGRRPRPPTRPRGLLTSGSSVGSDAWHGAASNGGAVLKGPEPITDNMVKPIAVIAPPTPFGPPPPAVSGPAPAPAASDYGQLEDMLAQRGVLFQSLEGPDEHGAWRFRCGVPSRDTPGATHNFELAVPGDRGLAAMKAVLDQIDQYQRKGH